MATAGDIKRAMQLLGDEAAENGFDELRVGADLDAGLTTNAIALSYWRARMASLATAIDVSEGGSTRSLSQAWQQAQKMADYYQGLVDRETPSEKAVQPLRSFPMRRV